MRLNWILSCSVLGLLCACSQARADGFTWFGWDDEQWFLQDLPAVDEAGRTRPPEDHVAYEAQCFKVLGLPVWTTDGDYVMVTAERSFTPTEDYVARQLGIKPQDLSVPWQYQVPLGWIVYGGLFGLFKYVQVRNAREQHVLLAGLVNNPTHREAFALYMRDTSGSMENAILHMVAARIPRDEATTILRDMQYNLEQWMVLEILHEFPAPEPQEPAPALRNLRAAQPKNLMARITNVFLRKR